MRHYRTINNTVLLKGFKGLLYACSLGRALRPAPRSSLAPPAATPEGRTAPYETECWAARDAVPLAAAASKRESTARRRA